jgi:hypothetical protein
MAGKTLTDWFYPDYITGLHLTQSGYKMSIKL